MCVRVEDRNCNDISVKGQLGRSVYTLALESTHARTFGITKFYVGSVRMITGLKIKVTYLRLRKCNLRNIFIGCHLYSPNGNSRRVFIAIDTEAILDETTS